MAKKNDQTGAEHEAPVKASANSLEERHVKLREDRRAFERELTEIDGQIRTAINNGDLEALDYLSARKAELPRLFIAAATGETASRQAIFAAEDRDNLRRLRAAEDARDELQVALARLRARHEEELAAMTAELQEAIAEVGAAHSTIQASRNLAATNDAGFKRSMAALTGV